MRRLTLSTLCLMLLCLGCAGKPDAAELAAAGQIIKLHGSFITHGTTIPIKTTEKLPKGRFSIRSVNLNGLKVRDEQIQPLEGLKGLEELHVQDSYLTDDGMARLQGLKALRELDLHKSLYVTDKGLESLKQLPKLGRLELSYTRVSDGGIDSLGEMKQLKVVHLTGTRVTSAGLKKLRDMLPRCEVQK
jgi:hypothetical protein